MTSQEYADQLLAQYQLLWPLPAADRIRIIDETEKDMTFQMQLDAVEREMSLCDA